MFMSFIGTLEHLSAGENCKGTPPERELMGIVTKFCPGMSGVTSLDAANKA